MEQFREQLIKVLVKHEKDLIAKQYPNADFVPTDLHHEERVAPLVDAIMLYVDDLIAKARLFDEMVEAVKKARSLCNPFLVWDNQDKYRAGQSLDATLAKANQPTKGE